MEQPSGRVPCLSFLCSGKTLGHLFLIVLHEKPILKVGNVGSELSLPSLFQARRVWVLGGVPPRRPRRRQLYHSTMSESEAHFETPILGSCLEETGEVSMQHQSHILLSFLFERPIQKLNYFVSVGRRQNGGAPKELWSCYWQWMEFYRLKKFIWTSMKGAITSITFHPNMN